MAYHVHKGPDLQATEKIYRKIMSTGRDTGRFSSPGRDNGRFMSPSPHSVGRKSGHPSSRRAVETGSKTGYSSPRGGTVLAEKQMNRHFPDPSEAALKRTHDGVTTHQSLSPASTVRTGQSVSSKKRAVAKSPTPVKSPSSHNRGERHLTGVPFEKKILDVENSERWNRSYQALRLEREWSELHQCRNMKRSSEIVRHRVDKMYMMSGSGIRLKPKYDVNEDELQQLKDLSQARQLLRDKSKKYHPSSKGRKTSMEGDKNMKNAHKEATHPEIHIDGDAPSGSRTDNLQASAEWASESGSRPQPSSPVGSNGDKENTDGHHNNTDPKDKENEDEKPEENQGVESGPQEVDESGAVKEETAEQEEAEEKPDQVEGGDGDVVQGEENGESNDTKEQTEQEGGDRLEGDRVEGEEDEDKTAGDELDLNLESQDRTDVKDPVEGRSEEGEGEVEGQAEGEDVEGKDVDEGKGTEGGEEKTDS